MHNRRAGPKKGVGNFGLAAFGRKVFYGIDYLDWIFSVFVQTVKGRKQLNPRPRIILMCPVNDRGSIIPRPVKGWWVVSHPGSFKIFYYWVDGWSPERWSQLWDSRPHWTGSISNEFLNVEIKRVWCQIVSWRAKIG